MPESVPWLLSVKVSLLSELEFELSSSESSVDLISDKSDAVTFSLSAYSLSTDLIDLSVLIISALCFFSASVLSSAVFGVSLATVPAL